MEATAKKATFQKYPAYKESGVEWLGELPKNWDEVPLCTLTKLKSVINCSELELLSVYLDLGVIKFSEVEAKRTNVTSQDLSKYQRVDIGDFVLNNQQAWRGSVGVSNHQGIVSPAYLVLELSKKLHTGYANYMFRSGYMVGQYLINSKGVGTIQRNLYWPSLRRAKVILPPLPEQTAIAAFLDDKTAKIDRAIAQKEKMIALLKERKQIIIQNAVTKGLDPNTKMKDSGVEWIGEIPEGWEVKRLKVIVKSRTGFAFPSDRFVNEGIPLVRIGDLDSSGVVILDSCAKLPYDYSKYLMLYGLKENDLLFAMTGGTIGKIAVYKGCANALLNQRVCSFTINDTITRSIVLFWMSTKYWKDYIDLNSIGGAQPNISDKVVLNIRIALSKNKAEQCFIISHIETQSAKIDKAIKLQEQQIEKLKELKSTLIDSAVTGKIKVS